MTKCAARLDIGCRYSLLVYKFPRRTIPILEPNLLSYTTSYESRSHIAPPNSKM